MTADDVPSGFLRHYPAYKKGQLNVSELSRVCNISRTTAYKYIKLSESRKQGATNGSLLVCLFSNFEIGFSVFFKTFYKSRFTEPTQTSSQTLMGKICEKICFFKNLC